ncbi:hypothetical protein CRUP_031301 [Coryphaenoides rupestris]|nr:hypothetical protein CRUP_031301 [Coryphaenoides rupestris]
MDYEVLLDTMVLTEQGALFEIRQMKNQVWLRVEEENDGVSVTLTWASGGHRLRVWHSPLRLDILSGEEVLVTFNCQGRLWFETLQSPPRSSGDDGSEADDDGLWKETFSKFTDVKANGPSGIGVDLRLHGYSHVYGLPEHADSLLLGDTRDGGPYRLYNLDVFAYQLGSRLGLYGSVPLLLAHRPGRTLGVFWLNGTETYVNVHYSHRDQQDDRRQGPAPAPIRDVHWRQRRVMWTAWCCWDPTQQTSSPKYTPNLPQVPPSPAPLFSLGYHQSRWSYRDEADVRAVDAGFDLHHIPYDAVWLDIDHTHGKRYFTWDPVRFPDPRGLQRHLQERKRKLVVISDPHIKLDPDWPLYTEARDRGHFVKDREGRDYLGSCWPGESCYLDFSNPDTRAWYSEHFRLDKYPGSTESLYLWNDMNEPSVFGGPEQTMPKDAVHAGNWEHRDLHNLYGFYQHQATVEGLLLRSGGSERPFVLTRSFFSGSQRLGAVWTGDNVASWDYLKISIPMLLSLSVVGISFCGADVGGFFRGPEAELLVRWYQAGALQPFFRGHSATVSPRREPWLMGPHVTAAIRTAIQQRPLWVEFPEDPNTFAVDNEYLIVTDPGATEVNVLLPGSNEVPLFQRGGTVVTRTTKCGSCTADLQLYPLAITGVAVGDVYLDDGHTFRYRREGVACLFHYEEACAVLMVGNLDQPVGRDWELHLDQQQQQQQQ